MPLTPVDPTLPSGPIDPPNAPPPAPTAVTTPLPAGGNVIGVIQITDASGVRIVMVKAAATPAVAGDPSLVVALSPNSPIPPGANVIGQVSLSAALPAGNNNIGDVDINSIPIHAPLTASAPAVAVVGVASAIAVAANAGRRGLVLTNRSANYISFGLGAAAVLDSGITLAPNGVWVMDRDTFSVAAIHAIAGAAASNLSVQEFV